MCSTCSTQVNLIEQHEFGNKNTVNSALSNCAHSTLMDELYPSTAVSLRNLVSPPVPHHSY